MNSYYFTSSGILKVFTIIIGGITYGLGVYSYDETIIQEELFLRTIQVSLIISLIYLALYLLVPQKLQVSDINQAIDIAFHVTTAVTLLVAGSLVIYSAVDNERTYCELIYAYKPGHFCQFYIPKLASGILTLFNGIVYSITAVSIFLMQQNSKPMKIIRPSSTCTISKIDETKMKQDGPRIFYYGAK